MNKRELKINTIVVDGDYESFKAALTRSVLGVTYRKFKRRRKEFYQHRLHNTAVAQCICDWLYEFLLAKTPLKTVSNFKIKTELTLRWDSTGKILGMSNVIVSVYLKVGELAVQELQVHKKQEKVKVDLFYSDIDAVSPKIRDQLLTIMKSSGIENFDYTEYNFQDDDGRRMGRIYHVKRVPTVIINEETLENPDEKELRSKIELAFAPQVKPTNAKFILESTTKSTVKALATELNV